MVSIKVGSRELQLIQEDITRIAVDAVVNAANSALAGGGGVDGAIHRAGGPAIMQELAVIRKQIGSCPAGGAVATTAGRLPAQFVFHAVGPIYRRGEHGEPAQLASCYRTCLDMAAERQLNSISFPSISTGAFGYPMDEATQIALETVYSWLKAHSGSLHLVKLVQFDLADHKVYIRHAQKIESNAPKAASAD